MVTISLCMIVKNEEEVLENCLKSIHTAVDEIIIVDTGSTDKTKEIASKFTNKIYDFKWKNDFSKARNYAFSKATKDYQMWLDADDVILKEDLEKIIKLKETLDSTVNIVTFKYNTHFDRYKNPILTSSRERLFKREDNVKWKDFVHEFVELKGNIYNADDIFVTHNRVHSNSTRNLELYENALKNNVKFSPRNIYYYARELKDNSRFLEATKYFEEFLESKKGWVEDNICACYTLNLCYKELGNNDLALSSLFRSFEYDFPRAEIVCEIAYHFMYLNNYSTASSWFLFATTLKKPNTLGFVFNDYWDFIPNIELCVCYFKLGQLEKSIYHNNMAGLIKPKSKLFLYNKEFFNKLNFEHK